jgi:hypothetical protein
MAASIDEFRISLEGLDAEVLRRTAIVSARFARPLESPVIVPIHASQTDIVVPVPPSVDV